MRPMVFWLIVIGAPIVAAAAGAFVAWAWDRQQDERELDAAWDEGYAEGWKAHQLRTCVLPGDDDTIVPPPSGRGRHAGEGDQLAQLERELGAYRHGRHARAPATVADLFDPARQPQVQRAFALIRSNFQAA